MDVPQCRTSHTAVYARHGRMADAHYYLGLYYKNEGDFKNAKFHLNKALKTDDLDRNHKIKELLKEIGTKIPLKNVQFKGKRKFL